MSGYHYHKCDDCGHEWGHHQEDPQVDLAAYRKAHLCKCGKDVRRATFVSDMDRREFLEFQASKGHTDAIISLALMNAGIKIPA